jgi:hypothetical protein
MRDRCVKLPFANRSRIEALWSAIARRFSLRNILRREIRVQFPTDVDLTRELEVNESSNCRNVASLTRAAGRALVPLKPRRLDFYPIVRFWSMGDGRVCTPCFFEGE